MLEIIHYPPLMRIHLCHLIYAIFLNSPSQLPWDPQITKFIKARDEERGGELESLWGLLDRLKGPRIALETKPSRRYFQDKLAIRYTR
jgi:hypothetical protein